MFDEKIMVTGAAGMLGAEIVQNFKLRGFNVLGFTRREMDMEHPEDFKVIIQTHKPDIIIHTAAYTNVNDSDREFALAKKINTDATIEIARIAGELKSHMIFISTNEVRHNTGPKGMNECDPISDTSCNGYGESKRLAEIGAGEVNPEIIAARVSALFGPGKRPNLVTKVRDLAKKGEIIKGAVDEFIVPTYTVDVATSLADIVQDIDYYLGKNLHIVNRGGPVSRFEQIKYIVQVSGYDIEVVPVSQEELNRPVKAPKNGVLINNNLPPLPRWDNATRRYVEHLNKMEG